jgi:transglutaminase-like putative cysteine protease
MKLQIVHSTAYRYAQPLKYAVQTLCLTPQTGPTQRVLQWQVKAPGHLQAYADEYGNAAHMLTLAKPTAEKNIVASGEVITDAVADFYESSAATPLIYLRQTELTTPHDGITSLARTLLADGAEEDCLLALARAIFNRVHYKPGTTEVGTTAQQAFDLRAGVCQDQAHVFISACRACGVPARYVSGYFYAANEPELASHAWVDVCISVLQQRWLSVDVTHECLTDERHIRLAVGVDYAACAPVRGVRQGGGDESMQVNIRIAPIEQALAVLMR